jgi:hypothetical protein
MVKILIILSPTLLVLLVAVMTWVWPGTLLVLTVAAYMLVILAILFVAGLELYELIEEELKRRKGD